MAESGGSEGGGGGGDGIGGAAGAGQGLSAAEAGAVSGVAGLDGSPDPPTERGQIPPELLPILERLRLSSGTWVDAVLNFGRWFRLAAGRVESLTAEAARRGRRWLRGVSHSRAAFA